jgi:uncharacterized phiE125 gp8 family phage protein
MFKVIDPPFLDPVTLTEVKTYLRLDSTDFDSLLSSLIVAAREAIENYQNRAIYTQVLELSLDEWPDKPVSLPRPLLQNILSVKYTDSTGTENTIDLNNIIVDNASEPGRISLKQGYCWPSVQLQEIGGLRIRYVAGYDDISKVPQTVRLAYLLYISDRFNNPDGDIPTAFYNLLSSRRLIPV